MLVWVLCCLACLCRAQSSKFRRPSDRSPPHTNASALGDEQGSSPMGWMLWGHLSDTSTACHWTSATLGGRSRRWPRS